MVPTFTGTQDRRQEIILCRATAIYNQCYAISVNAPGKNAKGQSLIVDPEGNIMQKSHRFPHQVPGAKTPPSDTLKPTLFFRVFRVFRS